MAIESLVNFSSEFKSKKSNSDKNWGDKSGQKKEHDHKECTHQNPLQWFKEW